MYLLLILQLASPGHYSWSQVGVFETEAHCINVGNTLAKISADEDIQKLICVPMQEKKGKAV